MFHSASPRQNTATILTSCVLAIGLQIVDPSIALAELRLNLDASDMSAINGGSITDGESVSSWAVSYGAFAGENFAQDDSNKQPVFDADGYNGMPSIVFDGSSDPAAQSSTALAKETGDVLQSSFSQFLDSDQWTFLYVAQTLDINNDFQYVFSHPAGYVEGGISSWYVHSVAGWTISFNSPGGGGVQNFIKTPAGLGGVPGGLGEPALRGFTADGINFFGHYNTETPLETASTSGGTLWDETNNAYIGSRFTDDRFFEGNISQIVIFDELLGETDLANVQQALSDKWGLGLNFGGDAAAGNEMLQPPVPMGLAGDFNEDDIVNLADYTVWRDSLGAPAGTLENVGDLTGVIGQAHYELWKDNFGATTQLSATAAANVPEPGSSVLLVVVLGSAIGRLALRTQRM